DRLPHCPQCAGPVREPARDRCHEPDRRAGAAAHGCEQRADPDDGRDVAVHLVRRLQPHRVHGRSGDPDEHRTPLRAGGRMSRVLFAGGGTGGHLYPALALADALQALLPGLEVHFVGAQRGVEARVLPQRGVPHTLLPFHPIYRAQIWRNATTAVGLSRSFLGLARIFMRFSPQLVVATGGYASAPAGLMAVAAGVPLAVQEQNSFPGMTVRMLARFAAQVHLGFPEAAQRMKPGRSTEVFTLGNPIRPPEQIDRAAARARFGLSADSTVVLIVGGSQGALALNDALLDALRGISSGALRRPAA